ncbi:MAG: carbohydrate ABC transporter permease, partial [Lachnospiraceae bacterium]|nr:carbohydrate ABC transporter permease [Lachnospiraceae bacterium]
MKYDRKIRPKKKNRKKKLLSLILITVAILYVIPIIFTICNSFMAESEIAANYGKIFESVTGKGSSRYISETVHLKFIPDMVSFKQYFTVLFNSPDYLLKFWNSVILVIPIVIFKMGVALLASYGFARYRGKLRQIIF